MFDSTDLSIIVGDFDNLDTSDSKVRKSIDKYIIKKIKGAPSSKTNLKTMLFYCNTMHEKTGDRKYSSLNEIIIDHASYQYNETRFLSLVDTFFGSESEPSSRQNNDYAQSNTNPDAKKNKHNTQDILYQIQKKLIEDLGSIIVDVKREYKSKISNSWVFDKLDDFIKGLQPKEVDVNYNRNNLEGELKKQIDKYLSTVQKNIPEIKTNAVYTLISVVADVYDLLYSRAESELSSIEQKSTGYRSAEELVSVEFDYSKAFSSAEEHRNWLDNVSRKMTHVFDYVEGIGKTIANKKGFVWNTKVAAAKLYLKNKAGIDLKLPKLVNDISVAKEAILTGYKKYENSLIEKRYH